MRLMCACYLSFVLACAGGDDTGGANGGSDSGTGQCAFCSAGEECCDGFCIDTRSSAQNCGECGNACSLPSADSCKSGFCVCNGEQPCGEGEFCCDNGCSDPMTDPQNCGMCGNACGMNETCSGGQCVCAGTGGQCEASETCCSSGCVDLATDVDNCGMCENSCGSGSAVICEANECGCSAQCPADTLLEGCCGDSCVDLCSDANNCGECGKVCPDGGDCNTGLCDGEIGFPAFECIGFPTP